MDTLQKRRRESQAIENVILVTGRDTPGVFIALPHTSPPVTDVV
jgi:hypothetical protein